MRAMEGRNWAVAKMSSLPRSAARESCMRLFEHEELAPGTRHQGPGTRDQGPGTRDQAPGARHQ